MTTLQPSLDDVVTTDDVKVYSTFEDMNLKETTIKGIYAYGFVTPSPIQQKAIIPFASGRDLVAQSQSGTGKTATFTIGMLERLDDKEKYLQAIILAPTRELAKQITTVVKALCTFTNFTIKTVVGGMRRSKYSYDYADVHHIIIGTPGRLSDLADRRSIDLTKLRLLIMDEADEMLSQGFREQLVKILRQVPTSAQRGLFSATIPEEMMKITKNFMNDPLKLLVKTNNVTLEGIKQYYVIIEKEEDKFDCLCDLYGTIHITQAIIYVNHKSTVDWLTQNMRDKNFTVGSISGGMSADERAAVMKKFRASEIRVLISTDLLARGIDVQQISLVLNYDIPYEKETYVHRIGRSGRYGRKGVAINFVTQKDYNKFKEIVDHYQATIAELPADVANLI